MPNRRLPVSRQTSSTDQRSARVATCSARVATCSARVSDLLGAGLRPRRNRRPKVSRNTTIPNTQPEKRRRETSRSANVRGQRPAHNRSHTPSPARTATCSARTATCSARVATCSARVSDPAETADRRSQETQPSPTLNRENGGGRPLGQPMCVVRDQRTTVVRDQRTTGPTRPPQRGPQPPQRGPQPARRWSQPPRHGPQPARREPQPHSETLAHPVFRYQRQIVAWPHPYRSCSRSNTG